ncbi:MAG: hypothetical protein EBR81_12030 [Proteobacteria bacterium]|jgi:hypothetical protein|nr:hypothetical protein [Pseudomonadota bacterium]
MTRQQVLDLYFMDARCKLIELAAFLDRVERSDGEADFRLAAIREALPLLQSVQQDKAKAVLLSLSDPTSEPLLSAPGKGACGAWPGAPL